MTRTLLALLLSGGITDPPQPAIQVQCWSGDRAIIDVAHATVERHWDGMTITSDNGRQKIRVSGAACVETLEARAER